jgi:hypothetical protein
MYSFVVCTADSYLAKPARVVRRRQRIGHGQFAGSSGVGNVRVAKLQKGSRICAESMHGHAARLPLVGGTLSLSLSVYPFSSLFLSCSSRLCSVLLFL